MLDLFDQILLSQKLQQELNWLKSDLDEVAKKCEKFFYQSPSAASIPALCSELDPVVQKMDQMNSLSRPAWISESEFM